MNKLATADGNLRLLLVDDLDSVLAALCRCELDHIGASLAPWGRLIVPVTIGSVANVRELARTASAPVDGLFCAVAELQRVTLLRPDAWVHPPSRLLLRQTLIHELAHCLLFQRCAPRDRATPVALPTWFREGMAVLVTDGTPTAALWRRLDGNLDLYALALADAALIGRDGHACYDLAHLLFFRWFDTFGARRLGSLCREMRAGHGFAAAFARACKVPVELWLRPTIAQLRVGLTDEIKLAP